LSDLVIHAVTVFMGFFAIMNPIANTPIFIGLTIDDDDETRRRVAARALLLAFAIIIVFCVAGNAIFQMFSISLPAFRVTGGILVFLIGFHMLQGDHSPVQSAKGMPGDTSEESALGVAVSPLAMPILAGPGTIAQAMSFSAGDDAMRILVTIGAFGLLCLLTYVVFVSGRRLLAALGTEAVSVITRMMGLLLAVIGMQMLIDGMGGAIDAYHVAHVAASPPA